MDETNVMILTKQGLTHIYRKKLTLREKSGEIEKVYDSGRHGRRDLGENHDAVLAPTGFLSKLWLIELSIRPLIA